MIGTGLLGIIGGGILPLGKIIATVINKRMDYKYDLRMREYDLKELDKEQEIARVEAENKLETTTINADLSAIKTDQLDREEIRGQKRPDAGKYISTLKNTDPLFTWICFTLIDTLRGLVRPVITFGLVGTLIYISINNIALTNSLLCASLMEMTTLVVTFWFGDKVADNIIKENKQQ